MINTEEAVDDDLEDLDKLATLPEYVPSDLMRDFRAFAVSASLTRDSIRECAALIVKAQNCAKMIMPKDPRTILSSGPKGCELKLDESDRMYIGLNRAFNELCQLTENRPKEIRIHMNFDGLPLTKSGNKQFWPILMSSNISIHHVSVLGIVYFHTSKPTADHLLRPFISDLQDMMYMGFVYPDQLEYTPVKLDYVACDLPALSLVKCTKEPGGYGSCTMCTVRGLYTENRMTYIVEDHDVRRTDASFRKQQDEEHHKVKAGNTKISPFCDIPFTKNRPWCNMVENFTIDPMHCVYQCLFRRLLYFMNGTVGKVDGEAAMMTNTTWLWVGGIWAKAKLPREFSRVTRSFKELDRYKATELRALLLYGVEILFEKTVSSRVLKLIRVLTIAVRVMSDPRYYRVNK